MRVNFHSLMQLPYREKARYFVCSRRVAVLPDCAFLHLSQKATRDILIFYHSLFFGHASRGSMVFRFSHSAFFRLSLPNSIMRGAHHLVSGPQPYLQYGRQVLYCLLFGRKSDRDIPVHKLILTADNGQIGRASCRERV